MEEDKGEIVSSQETSPQRPDISGVFNAPHIPKNHIEYFKLSEEDIQRMLGDYRETGTVFPNRYPSNDQPEQFQYALNENILSEEFVNYYPEKNFFSNENELVSAIRSKIDTKKILEANSLEEFAGFLGDNVSCRKLISSVTSEEELEKIDGDIVEKASLFNVTLVSNPKDNSLKTIKDVSEETVRRWQKEQRRIFGKKQNGNYEIKYLQTETLQTGEVVDKLNSSGLMALDSFLARVGDLAGARFSFPIDEETNKYLEESARLILDTVDKCRGDKDSEGKIKIRLPLVKTALLLFPYLKEAKTEEFYRKFKFDKKAGDVPRKVIDEVLNQCREIVKQDTASNSPDTPTNL